MNVISGSKKSWEKRPIFGPFLPNIIIFGQKSQFSDGCLTTSTPQKLKKNALFCVKTIGNHFFLATEKRTKNAISITSVNNRNAQSVKYPKHALEGAYNLKAVVTASNCL